MSWNGGSLRRNDRTRDHSRDHSSGRKPLFVLSNPKWMKDYPRGRRSRSKVRTKPCPVASIQSAITSQAYASRLTHTTFDMTEIATYWIDRYERMLRGCVRSGVLRERLHVIEREEEARKVLLRDAGYIIEDKLWRAFGTLRYARSLSFDEVMSYLSSVRLAVGLKLITDLSVYTLNKLLIFSQSAHLAHAEGRELTTSEANIARAKYVRRILADETGSTR